MAHERQVESQMQHLRPDQIFAELEVSTLGSVRKQNPPAQTRHIRSAYALARLQPTVVDLGLGYAQHDEEQKNRQHVSYSLFIHFACNALVVC